MKEESGRSLIEIVGVLAIGVIMIVSAYKIYQSINKRQVRLIAVETLKDIATKTKTLYEFSGYNRVSINQLQSDGILSSTTPPIGTSWTITSTDGNRAFKITLRGLSYDDCEFFGIKKINWGSAIVTADNVGRSCSKNGSNQISFTIR